VGYSQDADESGDKTDEDQPEQEDGQGHPRRKPAIWGISGARHYVPPFMPAGTRPTLATMASTTSTPVSLIRAPGPSISQVYLATLGEA
jgi:hypothetical protein